MGLRFKDRQNQSSDRSGAELRVMNKILRANGNEDVPLRNGSINGVSGRASHKL